jgi:hypothetical protein
VGVNHCAGARLSWRPCFADSLGVSRQSNRFTSPSDEMRTNSIHVGKEDGESDQIKFRLSGCEFTYGDFRDATTEDFGADKFEGFLVVASSKGDTLFLFEMKR